MMFEIILDIGSWLFHQDQYTLLIGSGLVLGFLTSLLFMFFKWGR